MSISSDKYTDRNFKINLGELSYNKTFEEEMEEKRTVSVAEDYLEELGIKVKMDYGYYRNTYDILLDLGEYLLKTEKVVNEGHGKIAGISKETSSVLEACLEYMREE